jgi:hypothetical protein
MKRLMALVLLPVLLAACAPAKPPLGAGFRFSTYGVPQKQEPEYWVSVGERIAAKFEGASPQGIWIVGNLYDRGVYLSFPCQTDAPDILCGPIDMNEAALTLFDARGVKVWLQVESGNGDMLELIDLVLDRYGHHKSVIGFGVDVEWYKSSDNPLGVPVSDEEAAAWSQAVRAHSPDYRLFLKHWDLAWMPPSYREGIVFINDGQEFDNFDAMQASFTAWGKHFTPSPVGYQFGYLSDRPWWIKMDDPAGEIGQALLNAIPNTVSLFWVDFTVLQVFPPES